MSYDYTVEKAEIFTELGAKTLLDISDNVNHLLETAGAFSADKAFKGITGSLWTMLACLDYLVEQGRLYEVTAPDICWAQHRVFVSKHRKA